MAGTLVLASALLIGGCSLDAPLEPQAATPGFTISDGAHSAGLAGFYFLPPMVRKPKSLGTFNPDIAGLSPSVVICPAPGIGGLIWPVSDARCDIGTTPLAVYSRSSTPAITVSVKDQAYSVTWDTRRVGFNSGQTYRVHVVATAGGSRGSLGYADVALTATSAQAKAITTNQLIGLQDGHALKIQFRIETGVVRPPPVAAPVTQLTIDPADDRAPTWSPDGIAIAFSSDRGGDYGIWRMDLAGGEAQAVQLTSGPDHRAPDWGNGTIAFGQGEDEIYRVSDEGGPSELLTSVGANPRYSPDGSAIAFVRTSIANGLADIFTMSEEGETSGPALQVTSEQPDEFAIQPEWDPSGDEIYFVHFTSSPAFIARVSTAGGSVVQVTPDGDMDNRHPAASPDGTLLAFVTHSPAGEAIVLQALATAYQVIVNLDPPVTSLAFFGFELNQNLEFSPDGTKLLFSAGGDIYYVDLTNYPLP